MAIKDYRRDVACIIHHVDVDDGGYFRDAGKHFATESTIKESWKAIVKSRVSTILQLLHLLPSPLNLHFSIQLSHILLFHQLQVPDNIRVRAFFVENLSGPILQMLGAK